MSGSGAGTGKETIPVVVRLILSAVPRALTVCIAAAAGAIVRLAVVRLFGTTIPRLAVATILVSALFPALSPGKGYFPDWIIPSAYCCGKFSLLCPC